MKHDPRYRPHIPEKKLPLKERQNFWTIWKKERHQGFYCCSQCDEVVFCAGERYDLMICWDCFFPELVGQGPHQIREREQKEHGIVNREAVRKPQEARRG